jgi:hypothetical protein
MPPMGSVLGAGLLQGVFVQVSLNVDVEEAGGAAE